MGDTPPTKHPNIYTISAKLPDINRISTNQGVMGDTPPAKHPNIYTISAKLPDINGEVS
jgi:hypothetical protein